METWELPEKNVSVQKENHCVWFRVDCKPPCESSRLLRCYGENAPKDLLIGVLEPKNGRLFLERKLSREALRQAEVTELPTRFYLSDGGAREPIPEPVDAAPETEAAKDTDPEPVPEESEAPAAAEPAAPSAETPPSSETVETVSAEEETSIPTDETTRTAEAPAEPASLDESPAAPFQLTGDALLDAVLLRGEAQIEPADDGLRITCPFSPVQPFPLAFIAPLCRTEHERAVLDWDPKQEPLS